MPLQGFSRECIRFLRPPFDDRENVDWNRSDGSSDSCGHRGRRRTILGVLGESGRMVDIEREQLIRAAVSAAAGASGDRWTSPGERWRPRTLSRMAESLGGAVMVTPSREPVPGAGSRLRILPAGRSGISIPVVVQDHPASTEVHMSVELMLRIVRRSPGSVQSRRRPPTTGENRRADPGMTNRRCPS